MKSVKVVSKIMGGPVYPGAKTDTFAEQIEDLVNEGYDIKAAGCSGGGYGDYKGAHLCVAVLQKNLEKLEELED